MADTADFDGVVRMLRAAAGRIEANREHLNKLDTAVGDGDHGSAMLRVAKAIQSTIDKDTSKELKTLVHDIGWAVMAVPGGSTGPLFGSLVMGMSEGVGEKNALDAAGVAEMFEAAQAKIRKQSKAKEGDKTLIDALVPAVKAVREAADAGKTIADALEAGAAAALEGAEATKDMKAAFGRARNLGDRVLGHVDPGAMSIHYILAGMREGCCDG